MSFSQMEYSDEILRQKMKQWGINQHEDKAQIYFVELLMHDYLRAIQARRVRFDSRIYERKEIEELKRRVFELERRVGVKRTPSKVDEVYALFKDELEKEQFGKIVAIDVDSKQVVGIGNSVLEAYDDANQKTGKTQFDFRRVGYNYVHKV